MRLTTEPHRLGVLIGTCCASIASPLVLVVLRAARRLFHGVDRDRDLLALREHQACNLGGLGLLFGQRHGDGVGGLRGIPEAPTANKTAR